MDIQKKLKGCTVWFTGLACSGKTTLSRKLKGLLNEMEKEVIILDSDELRATVAKHFGYSREERDKHMRMVIEICKLINLQETISIAAVISPTRSVRAEAREKIGRFIEVYVKCPLEICKQRDVKGHYRDCEQGKINNFVGIDIVYEEPPNPDVVVETDKHNAEECAYKIIKKMKEKGLL